MDNGDDEGDEDDEEGGKTARKLGEIRGSF